MGQINGRITKKNLRPKGLRLFIFLVWYPTVKQYKGGRRTGSIKPIAFLDSISNAEEINSYAKKKNALIIIKPHPAQVMENIREFQFSNLRFISDQFLKEHNISSYEFIGSCDALLTDYSSVCFDYVLADKPIGLIWEDIEDYKKNPGLVREYEYLCKCGRKIYTLNQLIEFILDFESDQIKLQDSRKEIAEFTNYLDSNSTKRVVDFIEDCLKNR